jgi:hypothetical protein
MRGLILSNPKALKMVNEAIKKRAMMAKAA